MLLIVGIPGLSDILLQLGNIPIREVTLAIDARLVLIRKDLFGTRPVIPSGAITTPDTYHTHLLTPVAVLDQLGIKCLREIVIQLDESSTMHCNPLAIVRQLYEPVVVDEHVNDVADLAVRWHLGYCP